MPEVSRAVWTPSRRRQENNSSTKAGWARGSPAGDGDAALVPEIGAVTENLPDQLLRRVPLPAPYSQVSGLWQ